MYTACAKGNIMSGGQRPELGQHAGRSRENHLACLPESRTCRQFHRLRKARTFLLLKTENTNGEHKRKHATSKVSLRRIVITSAGGRREASGRRSGC